MNNEYHHRFLKYLDEDAKVPVSTEVKVDYYSFSKLVRIYVDNVAVASLEFELPKVFLFYKDDDNNIVVEDYRISPLFIDAFLKSILFDVCNAFETHLTDVIYYVNGYYQDNFQLIMDDSSDSDLVDCVTDAVICNLYGIENEYGISYLRQMDLYDDFLDFMEDIKEKSDE